MSPEYIEMDGFTFDDDNKNWIDNPPLDWTPPKDAGPIYSHIHDSRIIKMPDGTIYEKNREELIAEQGFYAIRIDAWKGKSGVHFHFRSYHVHIVPNPRAQGGVKAYSKKEVTGIVIPWSIMGALQEIENNPKKYPPLTKSNGKGMKPPEN